MTDGKRGMDDLRRSAEVLEASAARLELAKSLFELGSAVRRAKRRVEAREHLRRAMDLARSCDAIPLEQRARAELKVAGGRPRSRFVSGVESLTPAEQRGAELAAAEKTNRQIAQELFLTMKTVPSTSRTSTASSISPRATSWRRRSVAERACTRRVPGALVVGLVSVTLGACGGGGEAGDRVTVRVGVPSVSDAAPLFLGTNKGFFEDEGITVEPRVAGPSPVVVASVISGDLEVGLATTTTLVIARSKGLPLRIVSHAALGGSNQAKGGSDHILVRRDGPIRTLGDLEGRTVGVGALRSLGQLALNAALEKHSVDYSKVKYIEVPLPAAVSALEQERVDAVSVPEPFATLGLEAGHRSLVRPVIEVAPDLFIAAYFANEQYIERNRDVVARFVRAMRRSLEYAARHPDDVRKTIPTYLDIPPAIVRKMALPNFSRPKDNSTLELVIRLAAKYGFIERKPKLDELFYEP